MQKIFAKFLLFTFLVMISFACARENVEKIKPVEYVYKIAGNDSLKVYVFDLPSAKNNRAKPAIILFHGGGWFIGKAAWMFGIAEEYAKKGLVAISVEYRLSDRKQITPSEAIDDALDAVIWVKNNSKKLSVSPDKIITYGWSAGGHLAACAAVFPKTDPKTDVTSIPAGMIFYTSALSVVNDSWFKNLLLGRGEPVSYSPAEHIKENLPPCLIIAAEDDLTTPLAESQLFHENMLKFNNHSHLVVYKNIGHLLSHSEEDLKPDKEIQAKAYAEMDSFLKKYKFMK